MTTFGSLLPRRGGKWTIGEVSLVTLLSVAIFLGGTPNEPGLRIAIICLVACFVLAWAVSDGALAAFRKLPGLTQAAVLFFPALWLLQLLPLPSAIWESLPGRELARSVFDLIGTRAEAHPLSLTPADTAFGLVMIVPGLAAFGAALKLDEIGRQRVVAAFLVLTGVSVLVGLIQLSTAGAAFDFYPYTHKGNLIGFFANRNHESLLVALGAVFALYVLGRETRKVSVTIGLAAILSLLFLAAAIGTISRAGIFLTIAALLVMNLLVFRKLLHRKHVRWLALAGAVLVGLVAVLAGNGRVQSAFERYDRVDEDSRLLFWERSYPLAEQYFPFGGGLGGFVKHYRTTEPLDAVHTKYLNHAHNEYLELLIEAGLPGMVAVLVFALALAFRFRTVGGLGQLSQIPFAVPAGLAMVLVASHSVVDYPLRTQSLAVVFGIFASLYLASPATGVRTRRVRRRRHERVDAIAAAA